MKKRILILSVVAIFFLSLSLPAVAVGTLVSTGEIDAPGVAEAVEATEALDSQEPQAELNAPAADMANAKTEYGEDEQVISEEGIAFIKQFIVFQKNAYEVDGEWYIGYGSRCNEEDYPNGISEKNAAELLLRDLEEPRQWVNAFLSKYTITLSAHQFDALVSMTFSLGDSWTQHTDVLNYLLSGGYTATGFMTAFFDWSYRLSDADEAVLERMMEETSLFLYGYEDKKPKFSYVIFDPDYGKCEALIVCYEVGKAYGTFPKAVRTQYRFEGWYTASGNQITADTVAGTSVVLTAHWARTASLSFLDVNESDWFYSYVYDLYYADIISGHSAATFAPYDTVSYGQTLKLALLAAGHKVQRPTTSHWASGYLQYARNQSIVTGTVNLDLPITRLEIAKIAARALDLPTNHTVDSPFADTQDAYVLALYEMGILEGIYDANNILRYYPDNDLSRAEISAIIWRMEQYESPEKEEELPSPGPDVTHSKQFDYKGQKVNICEGVPLNTYDVNAFYTSKGFKYYEDSQYTSKVGIDVSIYQGNIDWKKVKAAGVDFAIIRVGGRGYGSGGNIYSDTRFEQNIQGALDAGLEVGVYFFSQAISAAEGLEEAQYTLSKIKGYDITYPVVFDWEKIGGTSSRTYGLSVAKLCAAANAFCKEVEAAGYEAMVYFNIDCAYFAYDLCQVKDYKFWFAQYYSQPTVYYSFDIWQYTDSGVVDGISAKVDLNVEFIRK